MKKMIIIGAGITGLTAGIYALEKGYDTSIYEKNNWPGGCCTGWFREGYYIDNCMHWLTGTNQHTKDFKLWKKIGAIDETSNLYQGEYFYKSTYGNDSITLYSDLEKTRTEMLKVSYEDRKEINKFINITKRISNSMKDGNFFTTFTNKVFGYASCYLNYHKITLAEYARKYKHPLLKRVFTDYIPKEYSPLFLFCSYATFASGNGKVYQKGSAEFSKNILRKYQELGGKIFYNSKVTKITFNNDKFTDMEINNNETVSGDYLIYTGDPYYLYNNLIDKKYINPKLISKFENKYKYPVVSSFHVAYLVNKKDSPIIDTVVNEIESLTIGKRQINRLILRDYSYLYPNDEKTVIQVYITQTPRDYDYWKELNDQNHEEYNKAKHDLGIKLQEIIVNLYPTLKDSIKLLDVWTPLTYNKYYYSYYGSYMGFIVNKHTSLASISPKLNKIPNMLITTYWQKITGGLPVALRSGKEIKHLITQKGQ